MFWYIPFHTMKWDSEKEAKITGIGLRLRSGRGGALLNVGRGCGRGAAAVEGEKLGLVGLHGVEEGVVVGGTCGGDLAEDEVDVAGGGGGVGLRGIA